MEDAVKKWRDHLVKPVFVYVCVRGEGHKCIIHFCISRIQLRKCSFVYTRLAICSWLDANHHTYVWFCRFTRLSFCTITTTGGVSTAFFRWCQTVFYQRYSLCCRKFACILEYCPIAWKQLWKGFDIATIRTSEISVELDVSKGYPYMEMWLIFAWPGKEKNVWLVIVLTPRVSGQS
jgi:hypothetical protein